jgi:signal transduction histidine kinase
VETAFEEENLERAEELPQESQSWVIMADAQRIAQVVEDLLSARISVQS